MSQKKRPPTNICCCKLGVTSLDKEGMCLH